MPMLGSTSDASREEKDALDVLSLVVNFDVYSLGIPNANGAAIGSAEMHREGAELKTDTVRLFSDTQVILGGQPSQAIVRAAHQSWLAIQRRLDAYLERKAIWIEFNQKLRAIAGIPIDLSLWLGQVARALQPKKQQLYVPGADPSQPGIKRPNLPHPVNFKVEMDEARVQREDGRPGSGPVAVTFDPGPSGPPGAGPFAVTWDLDARPASPQSVDRAAIAALQGGGGGHGDEFFFGLGGGGTLSKLDKGGGRHGPGMDAFASITGGPRDMTTYAHGKLPGPKGPNPPRGKSTGDTKTVQTSKGPNPSTMSAANNPAPEKSTDKGIAQEGRGDPKPATSGSGGGGGGPTIVQGTTGGGGGTTTATASPTAAPNPPEEKSTDSKPSTGSTGSSSSSSTTTKGAGGGGSSTSTPNAPGGGGSKGPPKAEPPKPAEASSTPKKDPPPPPPVEEDPNKKHHGGGSNPNPEDTGSGGGGRGGPRQSGGHNQNPNPEDQGATGGAGAPRARTRSDLAGPRSYDAYPDPESTGGGGPRGRYNERPNPEDTGSPHGPSARNRSAIGPWSASRNRMV